MDTPILSKSISESDLQEIVKMDSDILTKDGFTLDRISDRISLICRFACPISKCDYTYFTKKQLQIHLLMVHHLKEVDELEKDKDNKKDTQDD